MNNPREPGDLGPFRGRRARQRGQSPLPPAFPGPDYDHLFGIRRTDLERLRRVLADARAGTVTLPHWRLEYGGVVDRVPGATEAIERHRQAWHSVATHLWMHPAIVGRDGWSELDAGSRRARAQQLAAHLEAVRPPPSDADLTRQLAAARLFEQRHDSRESAIGAVYAGERRIVSRWLQEAAAARLP